VEESAERLAMVDSGFAVSSQEIQSPGRRFNATRPQYTSPRTGGASRHDTGAATTTSPQGDVTAWFFLSLRSHLGNGGCFSMAPGVWLLALGDAAEFI
jgi:hypothetical protein